MCLFWEVQTVDAIDEGSAVVACVPRRPVSLLFAVDVRSSTSTHLRHLWNVAFMIISRGIQMDSGLVNVTFVPEAPTGRRPGHGQLPPVSQHQVITNDLFHYVLLLGRITTRAV